MASLSQWSANSGLQFATNKCLVLPFRCTIPENIITLYNEPIPVATMVQDLGLRYSCCINFSAQAIYQVARARQISHLISRSFQMTSTKLALYKQRVRSILETCPYISSSLSQSHRLAIESVQRQFTKLILSDTPEENYYARCVKLKLEPLWLRRLKLNLVFLHGLLYLDIHMASNRPTFALVTSYELRNTECTITIERSKTSFHRFSFLPHYSRIWNKLPSHLRTIDNPKQFKPALTRFLTFEAAFSLFNPQTTPEYFFEHGPFKI